MDRSEATMEAIGIPIPPRSDASTPTSPTGPSSNSQQQSSSLRERGFTLGNLMRRPRSGTTGSSTGGNGTGVAAGTSEQQSILRAPSMLRGFNIRREPEGANPEQQQQSRSGSVSLNGGHPNLSAGPLSAGLPASSPRMQQSSHSRRSSAPDTPTTEQSNPASSSHVSDKKAFHIKLVPHLELSSRSLHFEPVSRTIKPGHTLKIGRFNERSASHTQATNANALDCSRVAFKSKVVSRQHAELFLDNKEDGSPPTLWAKDTKSSSGSFLNHIRLSGPGLESRLFQVKDGDVLQLGVDYQGGTEEMYRCVKMRVEINRNWQKGVSQFKCVASACHLATCRLTPRMSVSQLLNERLAMQAPVYLALVNLLLPTPSKENHHPSLPPQPRWRQRQPTVAFVSLLNCL